MIGVISWVLSVALLLALLALIHESRRAHRALQAANAELLILIDRVRRS